MKRNVRTHGFCHISKWNKTSRSWFNNAESTTGDILSPRVKDKINYDLKAGKSDVATKSFWTRTLARSSCYRRLIMHNGPKSVSHRNKKKQRSVYCWRDVNHLVTEANTHHLSHRCNKSGPQEYNIMGLFNQKSVYICSKTNWYISVHFNPSSQVVSVCTTFLTISNSAFCIYELCIFLKVNSDYFFNDINHLIFIVVKNFFSAMDWIPKYSLNELRDSV
jgi:hypothetical protein